ncbi:NACHT domain-containing protein [Streptomyces sp. NPDC005571]|uniref:NACHT domain-containing protein n=1 Tax=Streptomyces sp. NPDC005571 TaxID=3156888 RepID=UPI0033B62573
MITVGGRRQRRRWQLIGAACVLLVLASSVYAVWQISHGGLQAADTAGVLGLPLGTSGLVAATLALRKPVAGNDAELASGRARTLARQVADGESVVRRQLLGNDVQRINLHYLLQTATARAAQAPPVGQAFTDGTVSLPDITAYYRATRPARLIITGAPGAGKTVLALELLLALIADRSDHDPVPVRVPLAQWDTSIPLQTLLIQRLTDAYDWPAELAANIVGHGLVLPVLDGLDEMDPTQPDGTPDPDAPRARAALEQLNNYQDRNGLHPAPLILTCRTTHYDALPHTDTLIDAARITIAPVGTVTDEVADGPWRATLELRSGLLVKKFHAKIKFPHTHGIAPAAAVDAEASGGSALKGLIAGILLLATALLIITNRIRRRHDRRTADA